MKSQDAKRSVSRRKVLTTAAGGSLGLALTAESRTLQAQPLHGGGVDVLVMTGDVDDWKNFLKALIDNRDNYRTRIENGELEINAALREHGIYLHPAMGKVSLPPKNKIQSFLRKLDEAQLDIPTEFHSTLLFKLISGSFQD